MDIVIPLGSGSRYSNNELRFCLRAIEKHLVGYGQIFIIGNLPYFIKNVRHIHAYDKPEFRFHELNIYKKIILACCNEEVSDYFLFFNDDHFLLQDVQAAEFPYHHKGLLKDNFKAKDLNDPYWNTMRNTLRLLSDRDHCLFSVYNFDTHCPVVYNKEKFIQAMGSVKWSTSWGFLIKSLYCVHNGIIGSFYPDCKIDKPLSEEIIMSHLKDRPYFSTGEHAGRGDIWKVLGKLYPHKSKYEK